MPKWAGVRIVERLALINTARDFVRVRNAKIIIALRKDLIERVFRWNRDSGFQEEKYQSLYLPLIWKGADLIKILDRRIDELVKRRYTKEKVSHRDLLPKQFNKMSITEYICTVAERPRDIIAFFNTCILAAYDQPRLGVKELRNAEGEFSRARLRALADEWSGTFPCLLDYTKILRQRPASFKISSITDIEIEELCLENAIRDQPVVDDLQVEAKRVAESLQSTQSFKIHLMGIFYRIGLIGLKTKAYEAATWADSWGRELSAAEISEETSAVIHPTFHRVFGVQAK